MCLSGTSCSAGRRREVVGRAELVERLRRHPLQRALRADKLTLAALEGTLGVYLEPAQGAARSSGAADAGGAGVVDSGRAERLASLVDGSVETAGSSRRGQRFRWRSWELARAVEEELAGLPQRRSGGRRDRPRRGVAGLPDALGRRGRRGSSRGAGVPLTVGTAGHVDHGKTWLVRALTGKDTDRLPEERRRGISIDLGTRRWISATGCGLPTTPGHERFVRNMVAAGATGIDLFLPRRGRRRVRPGADSGAHGDLAVARGRGGRDCCDQGRCGRGWAGCGRSAEAGELLPGRRSSA